MEKMETEFDFRNHKVGDNVYHIIHGWVTIEYKEQNSFYVKTQSFNYGGKFRGNDKNPTIYPLNPFEQTEERMVEVYLETDNIWQEKILIKELKNGKVLCWLDACKAAAYVWNKWREIQPKKELTTEEKIDVLWKKFQENGKN